MPVSIVFGGQFGSEGKGKVAHFFAEKSNAKAVIRVGGPNSGHTVIDTLGQALVLKQLPTSAIIPKVHSVICSGSYICPSIIKMEIELTGIEDEYLHIDPYAMIITDMDIDLESRNGLKGNIGSTGSGTGSAVINRIRREKGTVFAKDVKCLEKYITNTKSLCRKWLEENQRIIIEGTQGFGLSLLHSDYYPYTTSRDTSAAGFLSESGLSPFDVDEIIMVIRTYPIRVSGNSGPLPNEISWDEITKKTGSEKPIIEYTSVTNKIRRVAEFDSEIVKRAIEVNRPTMIVLNHCDYCFANEIFGHRKYEIEEFISFIEESIKRPVNYLGFDRSTLHSRESISSNKNLSK